MALRRSVAGQGFVDIGSGTGGDTLFEAHLPKLAVYCLRLTCDSHEAVQMAERVLREARRRLASSPGMRPSAAVLFSVLREECTTTVRAKTAPAGLNPLRAAEEIS